MRRHINHYLILGAFIASLFTSLTPVAAAQGAYGFENGALTPWTRFGTVTASISGVVVRTGSFSLTESGGNGGIYQDLAGLTPGAVYQVTAYARSAPGTTGLALLWAHDTVGGGMVYDGWRAASSIGWDLYTVTFVATANGKMRIHLMFSGGGGTVYWDDVSVVDANGFENGALSPWIPFGSVNAAVSATPVRTGISSLEESGDSGGVYQDFSGLAAGQQYQVTVYARSSLGAENQAMLWVHDTTGANAITDGWRTPSSNGWDVFTVTFNSTATGRIRIHLYSSGGSGAIYWDDFHIVDASGFESGGLPPWTAFGSGNASISSSEPRSGVASLSETGDAEGVYQDIAVTPGALYQVTAYALSTPGTANQAELYVHDGAGTNLVLDGWRTPSSSGWDVYSVIFIATGTGRMRIQLLSSGGSGAIYWDDVRVTDASGFESGTISPWKNGGGNISNAVARNGSSSLSSGGGLTIAGLTSGGLYQVSAYARSSPGATVKAYLGVGDNASAPIIVDGARTPSSNGWDLFTAMFRATPTGLMSVGLSTAQFGSGTIYWDDVRVIDASGFESGGLSPWQAFGTGNASVSGAAARTGLSSLAESGDAGGVFQEFSGLQADNITGKLYQVTAYARSSPGATNQALLWVHDSAGVSLIVDGWRTPSSNGWDLFTVVFNATNSGRIRIHLSSSGGSGTIYWDDVHIVDASGFDSGSISPWTLFGGVNATLDSVFTNNFGGYSSLAETGSAGGVYQDFTGLTVGQIYRVTAHARAFAGTTSQAALYVHDTNGGGAVIDGWRTPPNSWTSFAVTFAATSGKMRIHLYSSGGAGTIYWDDITVVDVGGFEQGGTFSPWIKSGAGGADVPGGVPVRTGAYSLVEFGNSEAVYLDLVGLTPGTHYQVTAYAQSSPGAATQAALWVHDTTGANAVLDGWRIPSSSGWEAFTVTFVATANGRMRIHLYCSGASTIYWDDVRLQ